MICHVTVCLPSVLRYRRRPNGDSTLATTTGLGTWRMDQQDLGQVAERLLRESLAPATRRTYCSAQGRYLTYCAEEHTQPLPTNEDILCRFVAWMFVHDLSHQTMKSYLSAVRHLQIMSGLGDPFVSEMPRLQYVLKGARIERSKSTPETKRSRLPITPALLLKMKDVLSKNGRDFNNIMLWAAVCVCAISAS